MPKTTGVGDAMSAVSVGAVRRGVVCGAGTHRNREQAWHRTTDDGHVTLDLCPQGQQILPPWAVCMSGALAGMLYWGVPFPADVVKSKIQTGTHGLPAGGEPTIARGFQHTLQEEGVRGLYRGCGITVTRAAPGNGTPPPPARLSSWRHDTHSSACLCAALLFVSYEMAMRVLEGKPLLGGPG